MNIMAIFAKIAAWFNSAYMCLNAEDLLFMEMCKLN